MLLPLSTKESPKTKKALAASENIEHSPRNKMLAKKKKDSEERDIAAVREREIDAGLEHKKDQREMELYKDFFLS